MARPAKGTPSKKSIVEQYLSQGLKNKDVIETLKRDHKMTVSPNYVSLIKGKLGSGTNGTGRRRGRPAGKRAAGSLAALTAAVEFIRAAGSVDAARQALSAVEEIRQLA